MITTKIKSLNFVNNLSILIQVFLFLFYFSYPYINILFIYFLLIELAVINSKETNYSCNNHDNYYINYLLPKFIVLLFMYLQYSLYQDIFLIVILQILLFYFDKEIFFNKMEEFKSYLVEGKIHLWKKFYLFKQKASTRKVTLIKSSLIVVSVVLIISYISPSLQLLLNNKIKTLESIFVSVGSGFISATAIVFTLIIFVLQINVERLPYGLFRQISRDKRILLPFIFSLCFSIIISSLSLFIKEDFESLYFFCFLFLIISIIFLFLYSFNRALLLINPIHQLNTLIHNSNRNFSYAIKIFNRTLTTSQKKIFEEEQNIWPNHDIVKWHFFDKNTNWRLESEKAIDYSVSLIISNSRKNDYDIISSALDTIVLINYDYIKIKSNTFFQNSIIPNPKAHDNFLMYTLEHIRKLLVMALNKSDEQYLELILNTYVKLTEVYVEIDYPGDNNQNKDHAALVVGYFISGVESILPKKLTDVLMESTKYSASITRTLLKKGDVFHANNTIGLLEKLAMFGALSKDVGPVTQVAMEEISTILFNSLISKMDDRYFFKDLNKVIFNITKVYLISPTKQLENIQTYLDPVYSSFNQNSFLFKLNILVNQLLNENIPNGNLIINNLCKWSDEISQDIKEILLLAVNNNSHFTSFIIEFINSISTYLMIAVNSPHSNDIEKKNLEDNAIKLFAKLTFIPFKKEVISFVESYQVTNRYFEVIKEAYTRKCSEFTKYVHENYIYWAFGTCNLHTGWNIFKKSILALCILSIEIDELSSDLLKSKIKRYLTRYPSNFTQDLKEKLSVELQSIDLYDRYSSPEIYQYINNDNRVQIENLLLEIIDIINE